jgi:hypothetical protein
MHLSYCHFNAQPIDIKSSIRQGLRNTLSLLANTYVLIAIDTFKYPRDITNTVIKATVADFTITFLTKPYMHSKDETI